VEIAGTFRTWLTQHDQCHAYTFGRRHARRFPG
jgi:hypothetical protein